MTTGLVRLGGLAAILGSALGVLFSGLQWYGASVCKLSAISTQQSAKAK